jgi:group I intron endonuclease
MTGIYKITNKISGNAYIGYAQNIEERWKEHIRASKSDSRQSNKILYLAFNKYGIENFNFEVLEECDRSLLQKREIYWIEYYNTFKNGYNMTPGGDGAYSVGENNVFAKLTEQDVIFIRQSYLDEKPKIDIYRKYYENKISFSGFEAIWQGKNWKHIMPEIYTQEKKEKHIHRKLKGRVNVGEANPKSKLTEEQIYDIINLLEKSKKSQTQIAKDFGVSYNTINFINRCLTWSHLHNYTYNIRQEYAKRKEGDA